MNTKEAALDTKKRDETAKLLETFALIPKESKEKALIFLEGMALASNPAQPKATA
jgi:hypothetical protein